MFDYQLSIDSPWYLLLLAGIPLLWWFGLRSLSGLGPVRRTAALILRSIVLAALALALAEAQLVRVSDRVTAIYLIDQSLSVPDDQRREMIRYLNESIRRHIDTSKRDRAGVIRFGRDADVEVPPYDDYVPVMPQFEGEIDGEQTDLAGALKFALAMFPHDAAKRVVVITDGNETLGDAQAQAQALIDAGVSIDVVPIHLAPRGEVSVEKVTVSTDVRKGQPFEVRVVLNNDTPQVPGQSAEVPGTLEVYRRAGERVELLAKEPRTLPPGKSVLSLPETIEAPDFYTYEARFIPDDIAADGTQRNNRATAYTHVRGQGSVLLIEDWMHPGEFDELIASLERENLQVTIQQTNQLFTNITDLQRYDTVILANVPRSSGDTADDVTNFSDAQIQMLVTNMQQTGCGIVMLGGPNSFGVGGWANTELEKAMPVDFQIKAAKVAPIGALALIMHAGEMPRGNYWQRVIGREAIKSLGPQDYCGVLIWGGASAEQWLWRGTDDEGNVRGLLRVGPSRRRMLAMLDQMTPQDMPSFDPGMSMAADEFEKLPDASTKHMIIISDGDPQRPNAGTLPRLRKLGVRVTTVAVTSHGALGSGEMQRIARATKGKYYEVKNARALPKIYQREARRVSRNLIKEDSRGMLPERLYPHEVLKGIGEIPPVKGYVMSTVKESPLVDVALVSPNPSQQKYATLLASWINGQGRAVVWTSDTGTRWAENWSSWPGYDKLFSQIVRWSMRPLEQSGNFTMATEMKDGKGRIVVTALDENDEFLNHLEMTGIVVNSELASLPVEMRQVSSGRYVGEFNADKAGSYLVSVNPGPGHALIRGGVNVTYSDEYRARTTNEALLRTMAGLVPRGGAAGRVIENPPDQPGLEPLLQFNPFRRDLPVTRHPQDVWHMLVLFGSVVFFMDVFNRRVQLDFSWLPPLVATAKSKLLRQPATEVPDERIRRLQSRKRQVGDEIERRSAAKFEPDEEEAIDESLLEESQLDEDARRRAVQPKRSAPTEPQPSEQEQETYTERLLKAKQQARRGQQRRDDA